LSLAGCDMMTDWDTTIIIENNILTSHGLAVVNHGSFDAEGDYFLVLNNTVRIVDTMTTMDQYIFNIGGMSGDAAQHNIYRDLEYENSTDDSLVAWLYPIGPNYYWETQGDAANDLTIERTLLAYAIGADNNPVDLAVCTLWNAYDQVVWAGATDVTGLKSGPAKVKYFRRDGTDTTDFFPGVLHIWAPDQSELVYDSAVALTSYPGNNIDSLKFTTYSESPPVPGGKKTGIRK